MNSKRSGAVRLPLKEPVILKSEHDPFLYGNIAKRDVIETISRKAISSLSKEISENYKPGSLLSLPGITFKLQALNLPAPLFPGRSYHYGVPNAIPLSYKTREVSASSSRQWPITEPTLVFILTPVGYSLTFQFFWNFNVFSYDNSKINYTLML